MLVRAQRLTRPTDFRRAYRSGRRVGTPLVTVYYVRGEEKTRAGFVVSTKVAKQSTRRNRIKRILREVFRATLPFLPPGDYVVVAGLRAREQADAILREQFIQTLGRIQRKYSS